MLKLNKLILSLFVLCTFIFAKDALSAPISNPSNEYDAERSTEVNSFFDKIERKRNRTLSLDSRFFLFDDQQQDIRGLMPFGKELSNIRATVLDYSTKWFERDDGTTNRIAQFFLVEFLPGWFFEHAYSVSLHEQGHGSRSAMSGVKYEFEGGGKSFFRYFGYKIGKGNVEEGYTEHENPLNVNYSTYNFITDTAIDQTLGDPVKISKYRLIVNAGGLNAQTAYAEYLQKQIYLNGGDISMGLGLMINKMAHITYTKPTDEERKNPRVSSDLLNIERNYDAVGINVTADDISTGGAIAALFSASTWSYFMSLRNFFNTGDTTMSSLEYRGFRIPDTTCYITSRGLSMKVDTGYRFSDVLIATLGVENVYKGKSATEYTLGVQYEMPVKHGLILSGYAITGYGKGYGFESELKLNKSLSLFAGGNYDEYKGLYGERNIVSLRTGDSCWSMFGGVRLYY